MILAKKNSWRYHHINWDQKNIPIQRKDITWLDDMYLSNEAEFPILQFQISKSFGRVVGFWDENHLFNIILLDPLHNIQPSKSYGYKVDRCGPLSSEYTQLLSHLDSLKQMKLCEPTCGYKHAITDINTNTTISSNVLVHYLSDEEKEQLDTAVDGTTSYKDILMLGAALMLEK